MALTTSNSVKYAHRNVEKRHFQNLKLARSASNSVKNNRRLAPSKKTSFSQSVVFYVKNNPPRASRHAPYPWNPRAGQREPWAHALTGKM